MGKYHHWDLVNVGVFFYFAANRHYPDRLSSYNKSHQLIRKRCTDLSHSSFFHEHTFFLWFHSYCFHSLFINFRFDPSRFLNTNLPRFAFEPFGLTGPRRCPGFQFAYSEIMIVMTTILPKFKFRLVDDQPVERAYNLVTKPDRDIFVTVEYRK